MRERDTNLASVAPELDWPAGVDLVSQAHLWTPMTLYDWQCDILRACQVRGKRIAVVGPNEMGKTKGILPPLGLGFMAAFPGCQVVSTAGVERQIKVQLWPALKAALRPYPRWKITDDLKIQAPSVRGIPGATWEAFTTKDPAYAEGFHPSWYRDEDGNMVYAPLIIIIDEAKSFDDPEMMFAFVQRCSPDVLLMISSPGSDTGPFFDAFHKERNDPWECFEVGWEQCPHLRVGFKLQERLDMIRKRGEDDPAVLSWLGKFHRRADLMIFKYMEDVSAAMRGNIPWLRGSRSFAVDFSGGGDEQVIGQRTGNKIMPLEFFHEKDDVRFSEMCIERFKKWGAKPEEIVADNGGAGKTCIDILESRGFKGIKRYMSNDEAKDKERYRYRSTEDCFNLQARLRIASLILPDDRQLEDEMRRRRYLLKNDDSRYQIEPKEDLRNRGEDSPNRLDCVVMLTCDMEEIDWTPYMGPQKDVSRNFCPSVADAQRQMRQWQAEAREGGGWWADNFEE